MDVYKIQNQIVPQMILMTVEYVLVVMLIRIVPENVVVMLWKTTVILVMMIHLMIA